MKSTTPFTGGHPRKFRLDDIAHLNDAVTETITAIMAGFKAVPSFYLTNTVLTVTGGNLTCDPGWMIYKGEPCQFDAQSVAIPLGLYLPAWVPAVTYRSSDPKTYGDGTSKSPHVIRKVKIVYYPLITPPGDYVNLGQTLPSFGQAIGAELSVVNYNLVGAVGEPAFTHGSTPAGTEYPLQFMKDNIGFLHIRGAFDIVTFPADTLYDICTLPASCAPLKPVSLPIRIRQGSWEVFNGFCNITATGIIQIGSHEVSGLNFTVEIGPVAVDLNS
jgi:hypothetical protein